MKSARKNWHPEDIKAEVRKRRGTLTGVALSAGLSASACRVAFLKPVPTANRAIASFIGHPVNELWPQWFDTSGRRKSTNSAQNNSPKHERGHRQKQATK